MKTTLTQSWPPRAPRRLAGPRALTRAALIAIAHWVAFCALAAGCIIEERTFDEHLANCTDYCSLVESKCQGDLAVYDEDPARPRGVCMATCALMDPGDELSGDRGNTLRCRLENLRRADFEPPGLCAGMGPGGNGICGTDCEAYCDMRPAVCGELQPNEPEIGNRDLCLRACEGLVDEDTFSADDDLNEDTLQCRMIHLAEAAISKGLATEHCWHTQLVLRRADSPCAENKSIAPEESCRRYCRLVMTACQDELQVYDDAEQCERVCIALEQGEKADIEGNSVACRRYHSYSALTGPEEHCTHAGPTGDGHCGTDNCTSACRLLEQGCPTRYAERYAGSSCAEACAALEDSGVDGFRDLPPRYHVSPPPTGATLKCRTLHAVRALATPDDPSECAAAFGEPGTACE